MLNALKVSTYLQLVIYFRIKQAVFFALFFPIFLFVLFSSIWGSSTDPATTFFFLTGVIGMTIMSDSMYSVGTVIKYYYKSGFLKFTRKMPRNYIHTLSMILSRIVITLLMLLILNAVAFILFQLRLSFTDILNQILGCTIGIIIFSFLGLALSFFDMKSDSDNGMINIFYFVSIFLSNTFYPISDFNETIAAVGGLLPLEPILDILRGDVVNWWVLLFWLVLGVSSFSILLQRLQLKR